MQDRHQPLQRRLRYAVAAPVRALQQLGIVQHEHHRAVGRPAPATAGRPGSVQTAQITLTCIARSQSSGLCMASGVSPAKLAAACTMPSSRPKSRSRPSASASYSLRRRHFHIQWMDHRLGQAFVDASRRRAVPAGACVVPVITTVAPARDAARATAPAEAAIRAGDQHHTIGQRVGPAASPPARRATGKRRQDAAPATSLAMR